MKLFRKVGRFLTGQTKSHALAHEAARVYIEAHSVLFARQPDDRVHEKFVKRAAMQLVFVTAELNRKKQVAELIIDGITHHSDRATMSGHFYFPAQHGKEINFIIDSQRCHISARRLERPNIKIWMPGDANCIYFEIGKATGSSHWKAARLSNKNSFPKIIAAHARAIGASHKVASPQKPGTFAARIPQTAAPQQ